MYYKSLKKHLLWIIILGYWAICLWQIDKIPGEWYGDISIEHDYVQTILEGHWPWFWVLSAGPVFHYLITLIIRLLGPAYSSFKIASILTGTAGLLGIYWLGKRLGDERTGLWGAGMAAVSLVYMIFSRLGSSPQMLVPVLSVLTVYETLKYLDKRNFTDLLAITGLILAGLFTYPASWLIPGAVIYTSIVRSWGRNLRQLLKPAIILLLFCLPMVIWWWRSLNPTGRNFSNGYIGTKVTGFDFSTLLPVLLNNTGKALGMFWIKGDISFRTNLSKQPVFDPISGILFILGIGYWIKKGKKFRYLAGPLLIFLLPSISPGIPGIEIPSNSRSLGAMPFAYLVAGGGAVWLGDLIKKEFRKELFWAGLLVVVAVINCRLYFTDYANGLPNHNTPFGKIIAGFIDKQPKQMPVYMTAYGWGEWQQPEPKGVYYALKKPDGRENLLGPAVVNCGQITTQNGAVIIFNPGDIQTIKYFNLCFPGSQRAIFISDRGIRVFYWMKVTPGSEVF